MPQNLIIRLTSTVITIILALLMAFFGWFRSTVLSLFKCEETTTCSQTTEPVTEPTSREETTTSPETTTESTTQSTTKAKESTSINIIEDKTTTESGKLIRSCAFTRKMSFGGSKLERVEAATTDKTGAYYCCGLVQSTDGDFSGINSSNYGSPSGFIMKLNKNGTTAWTKVFGQNGKKCYFTSMTCLSNGNIAVGGYSTATAKTGALIYQAFVAIYSAEGNMVNLIPFVGTGSSFIESITTTPTGFAIGGKTQCHDGSFAFIPSTYDSYYGFIIWSDNSGNVLNTKCWGGSRGASVEELECDSDGNIFAGILTSSRNGDFASYSGFVSSASENDTVILKLDSDGNEKWNKVFSTSERTEFCHIALDTNGNCYVAGTVDSFGTTGSPDGFMEGLSYYLGSNSLVMRLNGGTGNMDWYYTIRGVGNENVEDICSYSGGCAVVGYFTSSSADLGTNYGEEDGFVALFTPGGKLVAKENNGGSREDRTTAVAYAGNYLKVFGNSMSQDEFFEGMNTNVTQSAIDLYETVYDCFSAKYKLTVS